MPEPSPQDQMARMITGYWVSQMIYVAAKLGLADRLADGPETAEELAAGHRRRTPARSTACCGPWPAWASSPRMPTAASASPRWPSASAATCPARSGRWPS